MNHILTVKDKTLEKIFHTFRKRGATEARKEVIASGFDNWMIGYRYFFDNSITAIEKLIISEYFYRHASVPDKELNFTAMLYALEQKLLPYNYFPEVASIRATSKTEEVDVPGENKEDDDDVDIEKILRDLDSLDDT